MVEEWGAGRCNREGNPGTRLGPRAEWGHPKDGVSYSYMTRTILKPLKVFNSHVQDTEMTQKGRQYYFCHSVNIISLEKKHFIVKEIFICITVSVHKLINVPYASWSMCVVGIKGELWRVNGC